MIKDRPLFEDVMSLEEISGSIKLNKNSLEFAVQESLSRILRLDPYLNCVIAIDQSALSSQLSALKQRQDLGVDLPLLGVPFLIKDNICTLDYKTTACSKILKDYSPPKDAFVIEKLKEAGGIIIGKTNCDEFAMGNSNENSVFGPVKNPWDNGKVAGGSSGGSAAAVAAGMVPVALGSDTGGSVRQPASLCGVVGLKPTYGLVSRRGLIAYASSFDQIGPISTKVRDIKQVMRVLGLYDESDETCTHLEIRRDVSRGWKKTRRIGLIKEFIGEGTETDVLEAVLNHKEIFAEFGYSVELVSIESLKYALASYYIIATAEASSNLARYDGVRFGHRTAHSISSLDEFYSLSRSEGFSNEVKKRIILGTFVLSHGHYDAYYGRAVLARKQIRSDFLRLLNEFDFLIGPTSPVTAFDRNKSFRDSLAMYLLDVCTISANLAGLPAISLPMCLDKNGLPIGLQILGRPFQEDFLLDIAEDFEKKVGFRERFSLNLTSKMSSGSPHHGPQ